MTGLDQYQYLVSVLSQYQQYWSGISITNTQSDTATDNRSLVLWQLLTRHMAADD